MSQLDPQRPHSPRRRLAVLATLQGRLAVASVVLVALIAAATWIGYATVDQVTTDMRVQLERLHASTALASGAESAQIASIEALHSRIEAEYALAATLLEAGREREARDRIAAARSAAEELAIEARRRADLHGGSLTEIIAALDATGSERRFWLTGVSLIAVLLVALILLMTTRGITEPLARLTAAADRIGEGDLRIDLGEEALREFAALAQAFNTMAQRLRAVVSESIVISEQIAASATEVSGISEQVAASSAEVANAMVEITTGAESQFNGLRHTADALEEMRQRAHEIAVASESVVDLSGRIRDVAAESRGEVSSALRMLLEVREVVQTSAQEVTRLEQASAYIEQFVETITGIARQTNLLTLNAAIEAARAGEHGRGFAVVADEVRKLAEGSASAAREVAHIVDETRGRIRGVVTTIERGSGKVAGVEEVSRSADLALEQILTTVDGVRIAADRVAGTVAHNREAILHVEQALGKVSATAQSHAAGAEEVSAATEQQSAATQELSTTSTQLLHSATRMKELVSGLQV
jgi:methyl-accepting chemotaxis protein